jgi:hypothetical protein
VEGVLAVREFSSPRAWAFTLIGLSHFHGTGMARPFLQEVQRELADRLIRLYRNQAGSGWHWFEDIVTYDNAKLPEALLLTHALTGNREYLDIALGTLEFLLNHQTAGRGHFRPVGCHGFWRRNGQPARFDQQPLEAQAMTAACLRAAAATGNSHWLRAAQHCYDWFTGSNDHGISLALPDTGGCYDGLMEHGVNRNQGAESILAWLQSTVELGRAMARPGGKTLSRPLSRLPVPAVQQMLTA